MEAFPPGSQEVYVEVGTLLGYQGNYSGDPSKPVGVHLHFSIVKDRNGHFLNELEIENTLDPSPYFGLPLNAESNPDALPRCEGRAGSFQQLASSGQYISLSAVGIRVLNARGKRLTDLRWPVQQS